MTTKTVIIRGKKRLVRVMPNGMYRFLKGRGKPTRARKPAKASTQGASPRRRRRSVSAMARRRRVGRRRVGRRRGRGRGFSFPSVGGILVGINAMNQSGIIDAVNQRSLAPIVAIATDPATMVNRLILAVGPAVGLKIARAAIGPVELVRVGRFSLRAI